MKTPIFTIIKKKKAKKWSRDEDQIIIEYSKKNLKNKWKKVASLLKGKSASQVYLRSKLVKPELRKGRFTAEEDQKLKDLVATFGPSWSFISRFLKSRNPKQLRLRFNYHLNEKISKEKFSKAEDNLILRLYGEHGNQWAKFRDCLPSRTYIKIKNRCCSLLNKKRKKALKSLKNKQKLLLLRKSICEKSKKMTGAMEILNLFQDLNSVSSKEKDLSIADERRKLLSTPKSNDETYFSLNDSLNHENFKSSDLNKESETVSKFGLTKKSDLANYSSIEVYSQNQESLIIDFFDDFSKEKIFSSEDSFSFIK